MKVTNCDVFNCFEHVVESGAGSLPWLVPHPPFAAVNPAEPLRSAEVFAAGRSDVFYLTAADIGAVQAIRVRRGVDFTSSEGWHLADITVTSGTSGGDSVTFRHDGWLNTQQGLEKVSVLHCSEALMMLAALVPGCNAIPPWYEGARKLPAAGVILNLLYSASGLR